MDRAIEKIEELEDERDHQVRKLKIDTENQADAHKSMEQSAYKKVE